MDFGTIIGVVGGMGLILYAIISGSDDGLNSFINYPSMMIVAGGTFAGIAIAFPTKELKMIFGVSRRVFNNPKSEIQSIIKFLVECGIAARKKGNLVLEDMSKKTEWGPIRKGLGLIADGTELNIQPRRACLPQIEQTLMGNWGWIGGLATAAIFAAFNIKTIIMAASSLLQIANAQIASVSAGKFTTAVNSFGGTTPSMPGLNESLVLNLIIGALIVAGGLFTIGWSVKR